jgi:hypothetical protein
MVGKAASFEAETVTLLRDFTNQNRNHSPSCVLLGCVYRTPKPARNGDEPRLEHAGDQHSKRVQDGNHREMMRRFYLTTLIYAGWNFGKGQDKGRRS